MVKTLGTVILVTAALVFVLLIVVAYCYRRNQIAKDELNSADIKLFFHGDPSCINPSLPLEDQVIRHFFFK